MKVSGAVCEPLRHGRGAVGGRRQPEAAGAVSRLEGEERILHFPLDFPHQLLSVWELCRCLFNHCLYDMTDGGSGSQYGGLLS